MSDVSHQRMLEILKTAVLEAGDFMRDAGAGQTKSRDKTNTKDFVTAADIKSQNILTEKIHESAPDVTVVSEEHDKSEQAKLYEPDFSGVVIDPIDGTFNFKRGMRESAVSAGYIEDGEPVAGAAYDPYRAGGELFTAVQGEGACLNGEYIRVSDQHDLSSAAVATSNSYDAPGMVRNVQRQMAVYEQTGDMPWMSCPGSGVLIMAWIAAGRVDAYHHNSLKPWDNAAGFLLIREAGGRTERLAAAEQASFTNGDVLLGSPKTVDALRAAFHNIDPGLLK